MKNSQYTQSYLESNTRMGLGYTIGTFLAYTLRGLAKQYSGRYARALENSIEREIAAGRAYRGSSIRGGVAYYKK